jgi:hypothetical protein
MSFKWNLIFINQLIFFIISFSLIMLKKKKSKLIECVHCHPLMQGKTIVTMFASVGSILVVIEVGLLELIAFIMFTMSIHP